MRADLKIVVGILLTTVILVVVGAVLVTKSNPPTVTGQPVQADLLLPKDSYMTSTGSAKLTLVEFGDYQCPACGAAYPFVKDILKNHSDKVNFVFRNFPLSQHQNAQIAAEAAEAAGAQGKFWEMHDLLYEKQVDWSESKDPMSFFKGYATQLGLNVDQFTQQVSSSSFYSRILKDTNDGNSLNVDSTPTFFINGQKFSGSYVDLKNEVENLLQS